MGDWRSRFLGGVAADIPAETSTERVTTANPRNPMVLETSIY